MSEPKKLAPMALMPPPGSVHTSPTPTDGWTAELRLRAPQGFNPKQLLLDLVLLEVLADAVRAQQEDVPGPHPAAVVLEQPLHRRGDRALPFHASREQARQFALSPSQPGMHLARPNGS